jgi:hypothetical protein
VIYKSGNGVVTVPVSQTGKCMKNIPLCLAVFINVLLFSCITNAAEFSEQSSHSEPQAQSVDPLAENTALNVDQEQRTVTPEIVTSDLFLNHYRESESSISVGRKFQVESQSPDETWSGVTDNSSLDQSVDPPSEETDSMSQVTNVTQLRDVSTGDWAYEALRSLVERYGCIAGYPDSTYRGNRSMSRYEFAAGLNACLQQIEKLIASGRANFVTKEDLQKLQRLVEEFSTEIATLGGRVDKLEARTTQLEAHQFSTTTKLGVELITYLGDAFGENASRINNTDLGYRFRMDFNTSFTGQDRLRVRLQSTNLRLFNTGATFGGSLGADTTGLTGETRVVPTSLSQNGEVTISELEYQFPLGDRLKVYLEAGPIDLSYVTDTITPFIDTATAGISSFGQANSAYFPIGNQAGIAFNFAVTKAISLDFGYFGEAAGATQKGRPNNPSEDSGIFKGSYQAFVQLVYNSDPLKVGLYYSNSYSQENGVDTLAGSNAAKVIDVNTFSNPVVGNNYGIQANYRFSPRFELGGWVGYTAARALGDVKGDASIWNYAVTLSFPDLGKKGNLGGIVFGMQPRLTGTSNAALAQAIGLPPGQRSDRDVGFHIEAFYRYLLTDNISITPGVFWLTAPNHDERNPDVVIGVIRTSFVF